MATPARGGAGAAASRKAVFTTTVHTPPSYPMTLGWTPADELAIAIGSTVRVSRADDPGTPVALATLSAQTQRPENEAMEIPDVHSSLLRPSAEVVHLSWSPAGVAGSNGRLLVVCTAEGLVHALRMPASLMDDDLQPCSSVSSQLQELLAVAGRSARAAAGSAGKPQAAGSPWVRCTAWHNVPRGPILLAVGTKDGLHVMACRVDESLPTFTHLLSVAMAMDAWISSTLLTAGPAGAPSSTSLFSGTSHGRICRWVITASMANHDREEGVEPAVEALWQAPGEDVVAMAGSSKGGWVFAARGCSLLAWHQVDAQKLEAEHTLTSDEVPSVISCVACCQRAGDQVAVTGAMDGSVVAWTVSAAGGMAPARLMRTALIDMQARHPVYGLGVSPSHVLIASLHFVPKPRKAATGEGAPRAAGRLSLLPLLPNVLSMCTGSAEGALPEIPECTLQQALACVYGAILEPAERPMPVQAVGDCSLLILSRLFSEPPAEESRELPGSTDLLKEVLDTIGDVLRACTAENRAVATRRALQIVSRLYEGITRAAEAAAVDLPALRLWIEALRTVALAHVAVEVGQLAMNEDDSTPLPTAHAQAWADWAAAFTKTRGPGRLASSGLPAVDDETAEVIRRLSHGCTTDGPEGYVAPRAMSTLDGNPFRPAPLNALVVSTIDGVVVARCALTLQPIEHTRNYSCAACSAKVLAWDTDPALGWAGAFLQRGVCPLCAGPLLLKVGL